MSDMSGYRRAVRRSLLQRDLFLGIPTMGLVLLFCLSVVFLYGLKFYFMAPVIALLYALMRHLTSLDPWMIDMMLDYVQQKDVFVP